METATRNQHEIGAFFIFQLHTMPLVFGFFKKSCHRFHGSQSVPLKAFGLYAARVLNGCQAYGISSIIHCIYVSVPQKERF